jgi:hypothetical protein
VLADAEAALDNCSGFLSRSDHREGGGTWLGNNIAEDKEKLSQFNHQVETEPNGNGTPEHIEAVRAKYNDEIKRWEGTFWDREFQTWDLTYAASFNLARLRMVEKVSHPGDFEGQGPARDPKNIEELRGQCNRLGDLIKLYKTRSH